MMMDPVYQPGWRILGRKNELGMMRLSVLDGERHNGLRDLQNPDPSYFPSSFHLLAFVCRRVKEWRGRIMLRREK